MQSTKGDGHKGAFAMTKEQIIEAARKIAGCDITVRTGEVDDILQAGWAGIANGTKIGRAPGRDMFKVSDAEAKINGKTIILSEPQKVALVDIYASYEIVGARKK